MSQLANGRILPAEPAMIVGAKQEGIPGGIINAASSKTVDGINQHAAAARALGAGQKGSSRRRRRHRGGAQPNLHANIPNIPTAGSIKGVTPADNHIKAVDTLNAVRFGGVGDKLINAAPIQLGGKTKKRKSKSKRKHGRRSKRTHRRIRH